MSRHEKDFKFTEGETLAFRTIARNMQERATNAIKHTFVQSGQFGTHQRINPEVYLSDILHYINLQKANELALMELCTYIVKERNNVPKV